MGHLKQIVASRPGDLPNASLRKPYQQRQFTCTRPFRLCQNLQADLR